MAQVSIREFRKTEEEETVKRALAVITGEIVTGQTFLNLVIQNSNALEGTNFRDAYVYLRVMYEMQTAMLTNLKSSYPKCGVVHMHDILNMQILQDFMEDGIDAIEKYGDACQQQFLMLMEFLHDKEKHEKAIQKLINSDSLPTSGNKETQIIAGLAHHLFSQLVPGKTYEVDEYAKQLAEICGCGCKAKIYAGDTSIGSPGTWHGRVDVMLNNTVAVTLGKKPDETSAEDEDDNTDENEPEAKQRKVETDKFCDNCEEEEDTKKQDSTLTDINVLKQIFAKTITNGFAQVNMNRSALTHFLIPTFCATADQVSICLYDSDNDYLLLMRDQLDLWWLGNQLNPVTITIIWLFVNFTVFTRKNLNDIVELAKSGLHKDLKEHLKFYRKSQTKRNYVSKSSDGVVPWKFLAYPDCKRTKCQ